MTTTNDASDYTSGDLPARARKVMARGNTRSTVYVAPHPPYATEGRGAHVIDQHGARVIDANNNYTALLHGHAHPEITDAVSEILQQGTAFGLPTESEIALAELMARRTGIPIWRFSNSGTEAVMTAVRAARAFTGRDVLVRFAGSYHGTSDPVVGATSPGITAGTRAEVIELPQGDPDAFDRAFAEHGSAIAAVLLDLMPNRAGLVPADPDFVRHIRETTTREGALLIVDEVITLRLAEGGFAQLYAVQPDLVTAGKIIGGGFPVGAVGGRPEVMAVFDPLGERSVGWGGTFSANPMSMTAGRVAMELYDAEATARLNAMGDDLRGRLQDAGIAVSGLGSLMRLREQADPAALWWAAYRNGVLLGTNGLLALSTPMTPDDIDEIERGVVSAVRSL